MKTLCLGGSFNPIHHGHLICARAAAEARGFGRVLLIPSGQPPHKPDDPQLASPEHRLRMCQLAASATASFDVADLELFRSGPSFTIDTAQELRRRHGFDAVHWLIGADMVNFLPKWHQPLQLMKEVEFIIMARPGVTIDWSQLPPEYQQLRSNLVVVPQIDISATELRSRIRANLPIDFLTPPSVVDYIRNNNLYR
jgi:nicotinate-nucleotide adenylyltransferase